MVWNVDFFERSDSPLHPNEVNNGRQISADSDGIWHICETENLIIKAGPLEHRIPSFGYVIDEKPLPGKLNVEYLKEKGIKPGPLYGHLKQGKPIVCPDNTVINPSDVISPEQPGRKVSIMGDSCGSYKMKHLCFGSDYLVHESTLENSMKENAIEKGHSTPKMAADFAKECQVKNLVLTHFSQRYKTIEAAEEGEVSVKVLLDEAQKELKDCSINALIARDFLTIPVFKK
ncbi:DgyrCDS3491 [Dimorphilus gyrociliatus]|uniref:DgyrCDS3491 n=1 Tax=Dimorphilus gyrociliatus TaxID=2664684 RepID=A0A7I8VDB8_9ANNE|nr:DgyrCDS3491 [Dimorphilus gyrociliatus]